MACCSNGEVDDEVRQVIVPDCARIQGVEANGYVEIKKVKYRAQLFRTSRWCSRYCVLSNGRLHLYKDKRGKSDDPETSAIDLHGTLKISIRSYVARQVTKPPMLELGCVVTIVDKHKRKHKLRVGTGDERRYWTEHLAKATDRVLVDTGSDIKPSQRQPPRPADKDAIISIVDGEIKNRPAAGSENNDTTAVRCVGVDELAKNRRGAKDYVKWLRRQDSMLKRRERDLCAEIASNLPVRTSCDPRLNDTTGDRPASAEAESGSATSTIAVGDDDIDSELALVTAKNIDDPSSSSMVQTAITCFEAPISSECPAAAVVEGGPAQAVMAPTEPTEKTHVQASPTPDNVEHPPDSTALITSPRGSAELTDCTTTAIPAQPSPSNRVNSPPPTAIPIPAPPQRRPSALVAKMQQIFSAREPPARRTDNWVNLRSLTHAIGTVQFPSYQSGRPVGDCHRLITPPKPKWWPQQNSTADTHPPRRKTGASVARFKFDRSSNPVWKRLEEKSADGDGWRKSC